MLKNIKYISRFAVILILQALINVSCHSLSVTKITSNNIRIDSTLMVQPDAKTEAKIIPYRKIITREINEVLCLSKAPIYGGYPESPLTNLCADLLKTESDSICLKQFPNLHINIAMVNRGGLRVPIPKGEVKVLDMFELMPFENKVVFLKLSGADLRKFIDHMAARGGEGVSGVRFGIKENKAINVLIEGQPIVDSKTYWLATSDYLANGGGENTVLKQINERVSTDVKLRDMFIDHLRKLGHQGIALEVKKDGRIYYEK